MREKDFRCRVVCELRVARATHMSPGRGQSHWRIRMQMKKKWTPSSEHTNWQLCKGDNPPLAKISQCAEAQQVRTKSELTVNLHKNKRAGEAKLELQIAPLIDVVFLLLIYFMVTASLVKKEADVEFLLPADVAQQKQLKLVAPLAKKSSEMSWPFRPVKIRFGMPPEPTKSP